MKEDNGSGRRWGEGGCVSFEGRLKVQLYHWTALHEAVQQEVALLVFAFLDPTHVLRCTFSAHCLEDVTIHSGTE